MHFSNAVLLALFWMTDAVAHLHVPWLNMNGTSTTISLVSPPPLSMTSAAAPLSPPASLSATGRKNGTPNPIKVGVSLEGTSVVSIFYVPTGTQTTLMVATGEPSTTPSIPLAGYRTLTGLDNADSSSTATSPTLVAATGTPTRFGSGGADHSATEASATEAATTDSADSADSGALSGPRAAPRALVGGCMIATIVTLGYGIPVL